MINMPGRDGAVTGGTFDQSNRRLLPSLLVAGGDASDVVGTTVMLPAGAGSAAEVWSATPSVHVRLNFTNDSNARCEEVEKQLGFLAGVNEDDRQSDRRIAGFQGLQIKMPATIAKPGWILNRWASATESVFCQKLSPARTTFGNYNGGSEMGEPRSSFCGDVLISISHHLMPSRFESR